MHGVLIIMAIHRSNDIVMSGGHDARQANG